MTIWRPTNEFDAWQEKPVETGLHNDLPTVVCPTAGLQSLAFTQYNKWPTFIGVDITRNPF